MKLIINNNGKEIELDGTIEKKENKFYTEIIVPNDIKLNAIILDIKGEYNLKEKVTLINNRNLYIRGKSNSNESIYVYEAGYFISGYIDEKNFLVSSLLIYFKELDSFFVKDKYKIDVKKMNTELTITQEYKIEKLLENEDIIIEYNRIAEIDHDLVGHTLFLHPAKIKIFFKNEINLSQLFEEINKIERCLGFIFNRKMNLIETLLYTNIGKEHKLIVQFQKDYNDIKIEDSYIVDLNSKQLLKDILKKYYDDKRIAGCINMFYEYIYNDLDNIFEFTSLVNTLELISSDKKYNSKIQKFAIDTNEELKSNNDEFNKILQLLSENQKKFIKKFYNFEYIELRDKIKYIFFKLFNLEENKNSEKYISAIINTRNYFVHGSNRKNILNQVDLIETKNLLKMILYIMIIEICTNENNSLIDSYRLLIPIVYNTAIKYFN